MKSIAPYASVTSLFLMAAAVILTPHAAAEPARDRPPNLIIILTDDQGYADVGFNGCKDIPTPHIDRIANEGVRFPNGYVSYSVCGPSRAGLITGRYQDRFGGSRNPTIDPSIPNNGVPRSEQNIAELLKPMGYATMAVGKWHLGTYPDLRPRVRGFDEFYGFLSGGHDYFSEKLTLESLEDVDTQWGWYRTKLLHNGQRVATTRYLTDELSDKAVDFVERKRNEPFFLYLAYNAPHTPMQATEPYLARFPHIENERRRTYAAMIAAVDDGVGRLLDKLDEHGLAEDTIVFFLSDNGGAHNNASYNGPLRGRKGSYYEGGLRVPFAARWTGVFPAGMDYDHPIIALDIAGTIVGQSGATVSPKRPLDGVDLTPYLVGDIEGPPHRQLFWRSYDGGWVATRRGDDKYIAGKKGREFFRLAEDVGESTNQADAASADIAALEPALNDWLEGLISPISPPLNSWQPQKKKD
ncbi:MAG: sulfatase-like hydrolase/transferase [Planctomycetota bacterium]